MVCRAHCTRVVFLVRRPTTGFSPCTALCAAGPFVCTSACSRGFRGRGPFGRALFQTSPARRWRSAGARRRRSQMLSLLCAPLRWSRRRASADGSQPSPTKRCVGEDAGRGRRRARRRGSGIRRLGRGWRTGMEMGMEMRDGLYSMLLPLLSLLILFSPSSLTRPSLLCCR